MGYRQCRENLLGEVAAHVESSVDGLKLGEAINLNELGVVCDLQVAGDLGELRERDVGQVLVGDQGNSLANRSQVGSREGLKTVVVKTKGAVQGLKGGDRDGTTESEGQVASPDEVGQLNLDGLVVVGKSQRSGDIAKLHGDLINVTVVGNEDSVDLLDVDTLERAKSGVLDVDLVGLVDLGCEANLLQVGQGVPLDGIDALELGEADGVETGQAIEVHLSVELLEVAGADLLHLGVVRGDQVALDLLDAVERDVVGGASRNGNVAGEGRAGSDGARVTGILDGGGTGGTAGSCWSGQQQWTQSGALQSIP